MGHKSICAIYDPHPGSCDCGHHEREFELRLRRELRFAVEAEREACAMLAQKHRANEVATLIRKRGDA